MSESYTPTLMYQECNFIVDSLKHIIVHFALAI